MPLEDISSNTSLAEMYGLRQNILAEYRRAELQHRIHQNEATFMHLQEMEELVDLLHRAELDMSETFSLQLKQDNEKYPYANGIALDDEAWEQFRDSLA